VVVSACEARKEATAAPSRTGPLVATREPTPSVQDPTLGTFAFVADLASASEVPPITDGEAACAGQGRLVLRARLDPSGKITAASAQLSFILSGCPDSTRIVLAHVHHAPAGRNGAVRIDSGFTAAQPIAVRDGVMGANAMDIAIADFALVTGLVNDPSGYYLNVHSLLHPDGLVRGQLRHDP
jgi:hypothetical protein